MALCVWQAYLCGEEHLTDTNYEHRRQWVVDRLRALVSYFLYTHRSRSELSGCQVLVLESSQAI
ncbi:MAG: hypothetical protein ACR2PX_09370 [Endozoicomonas sp.]